MYSLLSLSTSSFPPSLLPSFPLSLLLSSGVSERAKRDEFSRDSVRTLEESEAKLRMKSEIYEKSKRGELWDGEEEAGFLVDFEEKKWEERFVARRVDSGDSLEVFLVFFFFESYMI